MPPHPCLLLQHIGHSLIGDEHGAGGAVGHQRGADGRAGGAGAVAAVARGGAAGGGRCGPIVVSVAERGRLRGVAEAPGALGGGAYCPGAAAAR